MRSPSPPVRNVAPARRWPAVLLASGAALAALAAGAVALEEPRRPSLDEMDIGLLQRNLLKIYVCGKESTIHEQKLGEIKLSTDLWGTPDRPKRNDMNEEQVKAMEDRHKFIFNYMLAEKTNAIQMIHIADKVLGTETHLAGEGRPERAILEKKIELIEIPRGPKGKGTEVREAGRILSDVLGCPVKVETIDTEYYYVWFTMGPTTGEAVIKQFCSSVPFDYAIENGTLLIRHRDLLKAPRPADLDEEEKKAKEEEERKRRGEK
jgi:hypothetical protein